MSFETSRRAQARQGEASVFGSAEQILVGIVEGLELRLARADLHR